MEKIIKVLIIFSAGVTAVSRYIMFKYSESFSEDTLALLGKISISGGVVLAVCAIIFVVLIKKSEKRLKEPEQKTEKQETNEVFSDSEKNS